MTSCDGRDEWPAGGRGGAAEALDVTEDAAESIERLRGGAVGFDSGRKGREGGGMAGEELAAVGSEGEEACRSWGACPGGWRARGEWAKAVGVVALLCRPACLCSSSSRASRASLGERGSSWQGVSAAAAAAAAAAVLGAVVRGLGAFLRRGVDRWRCSSESARETGECWAC